jgi:phosphohistidine phosphatase
MKLYIMRHGPAEDQAPSGRDFDRRLTHAGRERTRLVAKELGRRGESPKRILTSPLVRTVQTAEVVIETLALGLTLEVRDELAPGGNAFVLVRQLLHDGAKRVMLVGHEPDVSVLSAEVLPGWSRSFEKAMVLGLKLAEGGEAERRFVLEPKHLA